MADDALIHVRSLKDLYMLRQQGSSRPKGLRSAGPAETEKLNSITQNARRGCVGAFQDSFDVFSIVCYLQSKLKN